VDGSGDVDASTADIVFDGSVEIDGDGAVDADVAVDSAPDGGCACTPDEQGRVGIESLACFCAQGTCPSYDVAMSRCPSSPVPEDNRIDTYADCNLVVINITNSIGVGGNRYVYDATTLELVGASFSADYPSLLCGATPVFGFRAGTFPPSTCPRTQSRPRCVDGGDGG
jgi:hypothetical protein